MKLPLHEILFVKATAPRRESDTSVGRRHVWQYPGHVCLGEGVYSVKEMLRRSQMSLAFVTIDLLKAIIC